MLGFGESDELSPFHFMEKHILIVHYNTPDLTEAAIRSVWKHTRDASITVFDNSDMKPLRPIEDVTIIDNTKGQILDFERMIDSFRNRMPSGNGYGSAKHCYTVNYCMDLFNDGFILLDSDVLVKRDLSDLFDDTVVWIGEPHTTTKHPIKIPRLYPFCCFINTRMCSENGIHYFEADHMWQLSDSDKGKWYDTGAWFLEASQNLPHRMIRYKDYVEHYGGGSFKSNKKTSVKDWLKKYSVYYE